MSVDESRGDQAAAQVLDMIDIHDVLDHAGNAGGQFRRRADQAILSSCVRMAALLQISEPVHRRPMLVSRRTVTAQPSGARGRHGQASGSP